MTQVHKAEHQPLAAVRLVGAPADCVDRPRLFRRVDRAIKGSVLLLHGPAGSGKSVLASSWLHSRGYTTATARWIDCSETGTHTVPHAFAALADQEPVRGRPPVVVVDRLDQAPASSTADLLSIAARFPGVRLVVCSRSWRPMRIGHLAARGALTILGPEELAFTVEETVQLWQQRRGTDDAGSAAQAHAMYHGWPVAIQIAASSIGLPPDGGVQALASYFTEELIEPLSADELTTVLATAVADWSDPDLVDTLTGRSDAAELVSSVIARGLPLAWDSHRRLAVHPTFRQYLLTRIENDDRARLDAWRRCAASWMADQGHPLEALRLAVAGEDEAMSMDLLKQELLRHLYSDTRPLRQILSEIPQSWHARHWYIGVLNALAHAAHVGIHPGSVLAAVVDQLPPVGTDQPVSPATLTMSAMRLAQARISGQDRAEVLDAADRLHAALPAVPHDQRYRVRSELALFCAQYGENLLLAGRLGEAARVLVTAQATAQVAGLNWVALEAVGALAVVEALTGQVARAERLADDALAQAEELGLSDSALVARAHLGKALAAVLGPSGGRSAAASLEAFERCVARHQHEFGGFRAFAEAMALLVSGDAVGASAVVGAYRRTRSGDGGPLAAALLSVVALNSHLALQELEPAQAELDQLTECSCEPELGHAHTSQVRMLLQRGDVGQAWAQIQAALGSTGQLHPGAALVQLVTASVVAQSVGDTEQEVALSAQAASLAGRTGMSVPTIRQLVRGYVHHGHNPLTGAERLVLASLGTGETIGVAAARTFVSVNTYKTHLRKAYRKLDVSSRDAALAKAKALGWL